MIKSSLLNYKGILSYAETQILSELSILVENSINNSNVKWKVTT